MPSIEKKREEGLIGSSLDAKIYLKTENSELADLLQENLNEVLPQHTNLARIFIVSQVEWMKQGRPGTEELSFSSKFARLGEPAVRLWIAVEKADGKKCVRCWNYSIEVGKHPGHPGLCQKCLEAIQPQRGQTLF